MKRSSDLLLVIAVLLGTAVVAELYLSVSALIFNMHGVMDVGEMLSGDEVEIVPTGSKPIDAYN
ncbi:MAG: hypothetical protein J7L82_03535 [Staphylothermus sp.]|nr:hypothetical protein [Staphylothermus sp.]